MAWAAFVLCRIHSSSKCTLGQVGKMILITNCSSLLLCCPSAQCCNRLFCFLWMIAASREYFCPYCILFFPHLLQKEEGKDLLQQRISSSQLKDAAIERNILTELLKQYWTAWLEPFLGTTWDFLVGRVHIACQRHIGRCLASNFAEKFPWAETLTSLACPTFWGVFLSWLWSWLVVVVVVIMADIAKKLRR